MYRTTPLWYSDGLSEILRKFGDIFKDCPRNLLLLPSFPQSELESDGVHLTPFCGLQFVLHIFDAANSALDLLKKSSSSVAASNSGSIRVLEDRVMVLEQHQGRTSKNLEYQTAIFSESNDMSENQRHEDHFLISGLARAPSGLSTKEWQDRVQQDVGAVIRIIHGREAAIQVVHNQTGQKKSTTYLVKMAEVRDAKEIRSKFGSFFAGGRDSRPASVKGLSIGNWTTPATKVRIAVLKVLADR